MCHPGMRKSGASIARNTTRAGSRCISSRKIGTATCTSRSIVEIEEIEAIGVMELMTIIGARKISTKAVAGKGTSTMAER